MKEANGIENGSIEALAHDAAEGNRAAVELLITKTYDEIYSFICWKTGDENLAWDLSQDTYTRVWTRLRLYNSDKGHFMAWLFQIAANVVNDHYRARASRPVTVSVEDQPLEERRDDGVLPIILARENMRELDAAVRELPPEQREPLLLKALHGLKFREIAEILGLPQTTVQSRVKAGLSRLKLLYSAQDSEKGERNEKSRNEKPRSKYTRNKPD